jgi:hypothetical protein
MESFFEEERGPSTCPNEFRSEWTSLKEKRLHRTVDGYCISLSAGVVGGLLPARQCLHVKNVAAPKYPADNMWPKSSCRGLRIPARQVMALCSTCGPGPSDLEPGFLGRPSCGSLHARVPRAWDGLSNLNLPAPGPRAGRSGATALFLFFSLL